MNKVKIRSDLMSENFPSIWVEVSERFNKSTIIAGFYREWSHNGVKSTIPFQTEQMKEFSHQIEKATSRKQDVIIMGDANIPF